MRALTEWLWQQVSSSGVFSIQEFSKTVLAVCGLLALVLNAVKWARRRQQSKSADVRLYHRYWHNYEQIAIRNESATATATDVMLYFDGRPYAEAEVLLEGTPESLPDFQPGHIELVNFVQSMGACVDRAHVSWQDKAGHHETNAVDIEALGGF